LSGGVFYFEPPCTYGHAALLMGGIIITASVIIKNLLHCLYINSQLPGTSN